MLALQNSLMDRTHVLTLRDIEVYMMLRITSADIKLLRRLRASHSFGKIVFLLVLNYLTTSLRLALNDGLLVNNHF